MSATVVILNGGSSSGKTSIASCLQDLLPEPWLSLGVDTFIAMLPTRLFASEQGIEFQTDGQIGLSHEFTRLELCWMQGVAAMSRANAKIIITDGFLSGVISQQRWREALQGLEVLWVGVYCAAEVAAAREQLRGDRNIGMAVQQADLVHIGIDYDLTVDTTSTEAVVCAKQIKALLN